MAVKTMAYDCDDLMKNIHCLLICDMNSKLSNPEVPGDSPSRIVGKNFLAMNMSN